MAYKIRQFLHLLCLSYSLVIFSFAKLVSTRVKNPYKIHVEPAPTRYQCASFNRLCKYINVVRIRRGIRIDGWKTTKKCWKFLVFKSIILSTIISQISTSRCSFKAEYFQVLTFKFNHLFRSTFNLRVNWNVNKCKFLFFSTPRSWRKVCHSRDGDDSNTTVSFAD